MMNKNIYILVICIFFFLQFGNSQSITNEHYKNVDYTNQLWTEEEAYQMIATFEIQDSFFTNDVLKERFKAMLFMPQPDFDKYCTDYKFIWEGDYDRTQYRIEIKNINTVDEWINLLQQYPRVKDFFNNGYGTYDLTFDEYILKLNNHEELIFIDIRGVTYHVPNTPEMYNKHKYLKRLKVR